MVRTSLTSILLVFVASAVQATPDDFYSESAPIASPLIFTGETLLIARGGPSKDNDSRGKGGKIRGDAMDADSE